MFIELQMVILFVYEKVRFYLNLLNEYSVI